MEMKESDVIRLDSASKSDLDMELSASAGDTDSNGRESPPGPHAANDKQQMVNSIEAIMGVRTPRFGHDGHHSTELCRVISKRIFHA